MGFLQAPIDAWILASGTVQCILETVSSFFLADEQYICIHWVTVYCVKHFPFYSFHSTGKETETQRV